MPPSWSNDCPNDPGTITEFVTSAPSVPLVIFSSLRHHIFEFRIFLYSSEICRRSSFCFATNWINLSEILRGIIPVAAHLFLFGLIWTSYRPSGPLDSTVSFQLHFPCCFSLLKFVIQFGVSRLPKHPSKLLGGSNKKRWAATGSYPTPISRRFSLSLLRKKLERLQIDHITFQLTCWKKWTISGDQIRLAFDTLRSKLLMFPSPSQILAVFVDELRELSYIT